MAWEERQISIDKNIYEGISWYKIANLKTWRDVDVINLIKDHLFILNLQRRID